MFRTVTKSLAALALCAAAVLPAQAAEKVRFAVTDISGLEQLQREFGDFRDILAEQTGLDVEFFAVNSRTAAVEALKSEKIDFILTGPAEYVVIRKKTEAQPIVGFSRPDYFGGVIVMADSGIATIADLKGKTIAVGDIGSTSNHLSPLQVLADNGLDPTKDVKVQHVSRNVAWEALKRGDVDAVGMNYGKFLELRDKEKDLEPGAFRVVGRGPDLPNDVLLAGRHVSAEVVEKVRQTFDARAKDMVGAILVGEDNQKYKGMKFLTKIDDRDYNYVRSMYATIGSPEYSEFVGN